MDSPGTMLNILLVSIIVYFLASRLFFTKRARLKRKIRTTPKSRIADLKDGDIVKIVGRTKSDKALVTSPITNRECIYYHMTIDEKTVAGYRDGWETVVIDRKGNDFWIVDDSGQAYIEMDLPELFITMDTQLSSGVLFETTPRLEAVLANYGLRSKGRILNRNFEYREGALEEGEKVAVVGRVQIEKSPEKRVKILATDTEPVFVTDDIELVG